MRQDVPNKQIMSTNDDDGQHRPAYGNLSSLKDEHLMKIMGGNGQWV